MGLHSFDGSFSLKRGTLGILPDRARRPTLALAKVQLAPFMSCHICNREISQPYLKLPVTDEVNLAIHKSCWKCQTCQGDLKSAYFLTNDKPQKVICLGCSERMSVCIGALRYDL
jgi:hypothetical protein